MVAYMSRGRAKARLRGVVRRSGECLRQRSGQNGGKCVGGPKRVANPQKNVY